MRRFGLIGYPLSHTFSPTYFAQKFSNESISEATYEAFPLASISDFPKLLNAHPDFRGLNVTIPYKESVIPFLDQLHPTAEAVGAVNTIRIHQQNGQRMLAGFNTDVEGFTGSLKPLIKAQHQRALVLGSGGAAKAVCFGLEQLGISAQVVSRSPEGNQIDYAALNADIIHSHPLIVNTSPVGQHPNTAASPDIPYNHLTSDHLLFDLIYNPAETTFLQRGAARGAVTKNGLEMLELQAEGSWRIWNEG